MQHVKKTARFVYVLALFVFCSCGLNAAAQDGSPVPDAFSGASWMTADSTGAMPVFRKALTLKQPVEQIASASAYVCGLGFYQLDVNGVTVSAPLSPSWTNYNKSCMFNQWDIKTCLKNENVFALWLGNGFFNVKGGRYVKYTRSFGTPQFIFRAEIKYKDGSAETILSDESWKTAPGPIQFSCVYGGEDWRLSPKLDSWNLAGFDDSAWETAKKSASAPQGKLIPQIDPDITVVKTMTPEAVEVLPDGKIEANFGYNFSGRPRLTIIGKPGKSITITLAERKGLPWGGHSYTIQFADDFDSKTNPVLFLPHFTYWGFQYMYISGAVLEGTESDEPVIQRVEAEFLSTSSSRVGEFHSSALWLNDIEAMIDRSVRSNLQHVLTDCPHREKLGWLEVSHLMGPSIMYRFDVEKLYSKICHDISESQLPSGMVPDISPEYTRFSRGFFESAEWSAATVQIPWLLYRFYSNTEILEKQYPVMEKYMSYFASTRNENGLAKAGLGDWYDWSERRGHAGYSQHTPGELTATAFLIDNARIMSKISALLHKPDRAEYYAALAQQGAADFLKAYYNSQTGVVARDSQAAYAFALAFEIIPQTDRAKVMKNLIAAIERENYRPTTGEVSFVYLLRVLMKENRGDVIAKMIMRQSSPGYVNMLVNHKMKTLSETWDKPGSSMNHCMFGHAQEWFTAGLLGIRQSDDSTGFNDIILCPEPSKEIPNAAGYFDSRAGRISSDWNVFQGKFNWKFSVPAGAKATVFVPVVNEKAAVRFSGEKSYPSQWNAGKRVFQLPTGEYELQSEWE